MSPRRASAPCQREVSLDRLLEVDDDDDDDDDDVVEDVRNRARVIIHP